MKTNLAPRPKYAAFTLIEMIGVLAVIAILASLLIPKILNAINDAKVNNAVLSYNTMRTAVMEHYAKYGGFTNTAPGVAYSTNIGATLLTEGLVDKPFITKLGSDSYVEVVTTSIPSYDLDGDGTSETGGSSATALVQAVISGVQYGDAKDINDRLDGATGVFAFPTNGASVTDSKGRVQWSSSSGTLKLYIGHR